MASKKDVVSFKESSSKADPDRLSLLQEKDLSELQRQAREYRKKGLEFQRIGDLQNALTLYQKALELDPSFAVVYNDLGIIYEANGEIDRAEEHYLRSIKIDPTYLSAYANLALVYENKRELEKAEYYWRKRAELGAPEDYWTQRARQRLKDIRLILSDTPLQNLREQEIFDLLKDVSVQKSTLRKDDKALANSYFEKAQLEYANGNEINALKIAIDAKQLDPFNSEIEEFIDKIQRRILSR